tara:strand:+ start:2432 stop:2755 length:324 start_codon:yes stop_codon:yes gene_type:complete
MNFVNINLFEMILLPCSMENELCSRLSFSLLPNCLGFEQALNRTSINMMMQVLLNNAVVIILLLNTIRIRASFIKQSIFIAMTKVRIYQLIFMTEFCCIWNGILSVA